MTNFFIKFEPMKGTNLFHLLKEAKEIACKLNLESVEFVFNGQNIMVTQKTDPYLTYDETLRQIEQRNKFYN